MIIHIYLHDYINQPGLNGMSDFVGIPIPSSSRMLDVFPFCLGRVFRYPKSIQSVNKVAELSPIHMRTHNLHFSGYDPYIEVLKPTFFMGFGVQRYIRNTFSEIKNRHYYGTDWDLNIGENQGLAL